jgi:hypothetical protein
MIKRSPIYSAKHRSLKIGYTEGAEAFDLSGNKSCNYNQKTGNLLDFHSGKIIGHVSLANFFVGSSWIADELFPQFDSNASPSPRASEIVAGRLTETLLSSDAERAFERVCTVQDDKSPETALQESGIFLNPAESFVRADANTAATTSFNKAGTGEIGISGDTECLPETVGVKLSTRSVEPMRQTANDVATRMRQHLAQLRKPRPRARLGSLR